MDFRIFTEPQQGATYEELLGVAKEAEALNFDAFFRSDHYLKMGDVSGEPGPTDAWITLAGLARETSRIRLGTLMTAATFRLPGPLAIAVAEVDSMSAGRVEFGFGSGWYEAEHDAYGVPFPASLGERFDRFEEQLQIILGLWDTPAGQSFSFHGKYFDLAESPALVKSAQRPHPPVLIGGRGPKRTPRIAAKYGDEYNLPFKTPQETGEQFERIRKACQEIGRDPASITMSCAQVLCVGENENEIVRRAKRIGRDADELRENGLGGTVEQVVEKINAFADIGLTRLYLQILDLSDLDHLRLVAERIVPAIN